MRHAPYQYYRSEPFDAWGCFLGVLELIGFFLALSWPLWLIPLLMAMNNAK